MTITEAIAKAREISRSATNEVFEQHAGDTHKLLLDVVEAAEHLAEECRIVDEESPAHQLVNAQRQAMRKLNDCLNTFTEAMK